MLTTDDELTEDTSMSSQKFQSFQLCNSKDKDTFTNKLKSLKLIAGNVNNYMQDTAVTLPNQLG